MTASTTTRPCCYCVAGWVAATDHIPGALPILPSAGDCELSHRDDPRVYDLARAMAKVMQDRHPSDAQVSYFLEDANEVVDDFDPTPDRWRVRRLPACVSDAEDEIDVRLRIDDRLLTPTEVAALFRVDPKTVTRWAAAGRLNSIRTPAGTAASTHPTSAPY